MSHSIAISVAFKAQEVKLGRNLEAETAKVNTESNVEVFKRVN